MFFGIMLLIIAALLLIATFILLIENNGFGIFTFLLCICSIVFGIHLCFTDSRMDPVMCRCSIEKNKYNYKDDEEIKISLIPRFGKSVFEVSSMKKHKVQTTEVFYPWWSSNVNRIIRIDIDNRYSVYDKADKSNSCFDYCQEEQ